MKTLYNDSKTKKLSLPKKTIPKLIKDVVNTLRITMPVKYVSFANGSYK